MDNATPPPAGGNHAEAAAKKAAALETWLAGLFRNAPHLPQHIRQVLVDIAPWAALIGGILGIVGVLSASSFTSAFFSFAFLRFGFFYVVYTVAMLLGLVAAAFQLAAYKPLTQLRKTGWNFLFYGMLVNVVSIALNLIAGYPVVPQLAGLVIGLWALFEIRDAYKA